MKGYTSVAISVLLLASTGKRGNAEPRTATTQMLPGDAGYGTAGEIFLEYARTRGYLGSGCIDFTRAA